MQQRFFIADLFACSTYFGHHYAHHQELNSIIKWLLPVVFLAVVFKLLFWPPDQQLENHSTKYHTLQPLYNTLELLMMSIVVPETCWASNKICYEKPLLYVVGTLFPHINDDARSKSHQMYKDYIHDLKYLTNEKKIHVIFLYFMFPSCYLLHLFLCHMLPCSSSWPRHLRVW